MSFLPPAGQMLATPTPCLLQTGEQSPKGLNDLPEFGSGSDSHCLGGMQPKSNPIRGTSHLWTFVGGAVRDFQPV